MSELVSEQDMSQGKMGMRECVSTYPVRRAPPSWDLLEHC